MRVSLKGVFAGISLLAPVGRILPSGMTGVSKPWCTRVLYSGGKYAYRALGKIDVYYNEFQGNLVYLLGAIVPNIDDFILPRENSGSLTSEI